MKTEYVQVPLDLIRRAQQAINYHLEPNSPEEHEATMRELMAIGWPDLARAIESVNPVQTKIEPVLQTVPNHVDLVAVNGVQRVAYTAACTPDYRDGWNDALEAVAAQVVPGWKLVPIEMAPEMLKAAVHATNTDNDFLAMKRRWAAALAATLSPPRVAVRTKRSDLQSAFDSVQASKPPAPVVWVSSVVDQEVPTTDAGPGVIEMCNYLASVSGAPAAPVAVGATDIPEAAFGESLNGAAEQLRSVAHDMRDNARRLRAFPGSETEARARELAATNVEDLARLWEVDGKFASLRFVGSGNLDKVDAERWRKLRDTPATSIARGPLRNWLYSRPGNVEALDKMVDSI